MAARWWREWELGVVVLIVALAYAVPTLRVPVRGEEPRWSQVAAEMTMRGDLLTPRQQGTLFLSRPPLHPWALATVQRLFRSHAAWVIRLPSIVAALLACVLLYAYVRCFASRTAAAAAGVVFATFGEMMQLGSIAESDALFVLFVSGSLLLWHLGRLRGWHPVATWVSAYACVALAALCKGGPQPPVYFLGTVLVYLALTRDLRALFQWGHALGVLVAGGVIAAWLVPFVLTVGVDNAKHLWGQDTASRLIGAWPVFLRHLLIYPLEVAGSTMPWLLLALFYLSGRVRETLAPAGRPILFNLLALGIAFPTCWLPPGGETRYFAPLYPCLAVVLALAVEGVLLSGPAGGWATYAWLHGLALTGLAAACLTLGVAATSTDTRSLGEPVPLAVLYASCLAGAGWVALKWPEVRTTLAAVAVGTAVVCGGWMSGVRERRSPDAGSAIAAARAKLPPGASLVSLDLVPALFPYHFGEYVELVGPPRSEEEMRRLDYFCFTAHVGHPLPALPCRWEEVARAPIERAPTGRVGERQVLIGRVVRN